MSLDHAFLGITQSSQPCNHCQLLGSEEFESAVDTSVTAAARQIAYVQTCQLKYPELATEVLQVLVEARGLVALARRNACDETLVQTCEDRLILPPPKKVDEKSEMESRIQAHANFQCAMDCAKAVIPVRFLSRIRRSLSGALGMCYFGSDSMCGSD